MARKTRIGQQTKTTFTKEKNEIEARNIKNTYMLNDLQESDSDENMSEM